MVYLWLTSPHAPLNLKEITSQVPNDHKPNRPAPKKIIKNFITSPNSTLSLTFSTFISFPLSARARNV